MREGRPSTTACFVACGRGAAGLDPYAERLLPRALAPLARQRARRWLGPLVEIMGVRTRVIDEAASEAVREGITQVVVLGAGLCARAWRLSELAGSVVYEVDHPATQRYKRARLGGLAPRARDVRFVSVDFEKDDLGQALAAAGHDPGARTIWIWEGVTPYLRPAAIRSTLEAIRGRSAEASMLVLTYYTPPPDGGRGGLLAPARLLRWARLVLYAIGEPFRGLMTVPEMHRILVSTGFAVRSDHANSELAQGDHRPGRLTVVSQRVIKERIVVATAERADA
ncbi:MAG TPA: class I SAM-dependent methyltransferase [Labilithrix sp.]|nr:class I SAM-dependent methyltransferase [Labilithrix sp.]